MESQAYAMSTPKSHYTSRKPIIPLVLVVEFRAPDVSLEITNDGTLWLHIVRQIGVERAVAVLRRPIEYTSLEYNMSYVDISEIQTTYLFPFDLFQSLICHFGGMGDESLHG
jgi:hypothetical protein